MPKDIRDYRAKFKLLSQVLDEFIELPYSLVIDPAVEPDYFGYHSPDHDGFSGIGQSVENCLCRARWGMKEYIELSCKQYSHSLTKR
jgi:hypothetical protein